MAKTKEEIDIQRDRQLSTQRRTESQIEKNLHQNENLDARTQYQNARTAALLNEQGTWHEGGPMQFAQAGQDLTGLAYSAPYREGGNYIELNKPFQASPQLYQVDELAGYDPKGLEAPQEVEFSSQQRAALYDIVTRYNDVEKQLASIKYKNNPAFKELMNERGMLQYAYDDMVKQAQDSWKIGKVGAEKGYAGDTSKIGNKGWGDFNADNVYSGFEKGVGNLNDSLIRTVQSGGDRTKLERDRRIYRQKILDYIPYAPDNQKAKFVALAETLGMPIQDLKAQQDIAESKHRVAGKDKEIIGSAVLLDQVQRGVPAAIAAINAKNPNFLFRRRGNLIEIWERDVTTNKDAVSSPNEEGMEKSKTSTKDFKYKSSFKIGDPNALPAMAYMLYDGTTSSAISAYFAQGELDKYLSNQQNRVFVNISPDVQEHIRKNPKGFAEGLMKGTVKNMFSVDGKNIKKVELGTNGGYNYTLDDDSVVNSSKGELESSERFGLSKEALDILYSEKDGSTIPSIIVTYANGKKAKIPIFKKDEFVGSKGSRNTVDPSYWGNIEH